jgi:hypothetical protein
MTMCNKIETYPKQWLRRTALRMLRMRCRIAQIAKQGEMNGKNPNL